MIVDCLMLSLVIFLNFFYLPSQLLVLTQGILNDHVLNFDLIRRTVNHVLDEKFPVAQPADASSLPGLVSCLLLRSEWSSLLQALLACRLAAEVAMGILQLTRLFPWVLTCVARWCIFVIFLMDWSI